jgi:hypothetical protein
MEFTHDLLLLKTAKGLEELATRRYKLNPKLRQLLILIDGHRTVGALSRMVGENELLTSGKLLESEGYIEQLKVELSSIAVHEPSTISIGREADATPVAVLEKPAVELDFVSARQLVARTLNDLLGPYAEGIASRIDKTKTILELRDLLPAATSSVQAMRGQAGKAEFISRIGRI